MKATAFVKAGRELWRRTSVFFSEVAETNLQKLRFFKLQIRTDVGCVF